MQLGKTVSVLDAAEYILERKGAMTTWKLQKLVYYSQAWSLVWDDERLFRERIEAWANGPAVPALYERHRRRYRVSTVQGDSSKLNAPQRETVDAILDTYGSKSGRWLSDLTHREAPWRNARRRAGLELGERGDSQITLSDMAEYYDSLV